MDSYRPIQQVNHTEASEISVKFTRSAL
jgi:hypothetical protein